MLKEFVFISGFLRPFRFQTLLLLSFIFIWTFLEVLIIYGLKFFIDYYSAALHTYSPAFLIAVVICMILLIEFSIKSTNFLMMKILPNILGRLYDSGLKTLIESELSFLLKSDIGSFNTTLSNLIIAVENIIKLLAYGIVAGSFSFFITIALIYISLPYISLYFAMWYIAMVSISFLFMNNLSKASNQYATTFSLINDRIRDIIKNIITVKSFSGESHEISQNQIFSLFKKSKLALEKVIFKADAIRSLISTIFFTALIYYVVGKIVIQEITIGDLTFVVSSAFICKRDVWRVSLQFTELYRDLGFISSFMNSIPKNMNYDSGKSFREISELNLHNVCFKLNSTQILTKISLDIRKNEKIAIIGPSGSGKSTLAQLISLYHTPTSGNVTVNGILASKLNQTFLKQKIVYISQEPAIFDRSIEENIVYPVLPGKHINKMKKIAKICLCSEFIDKLPKQYNEESMRLSSGQKHRVVLARVIFSDFNWIILDEFTSSLDPISEKKIVTNLLKYYQNKTLILITHNPRILKYMNRILIVEKGKLTLDTKYKSPQDNKFYQEFISYE